MDDLKGILFENDVAAARTLLKNPAIANQLNLACFDFGMPPLAAARSREMAALMIEHGAGLDRVRDWWAPGFWLHNVDQDVAEFLVDAGASLTAHAASGLGLAPRLSTMLQNDPTLANAKGGDGARPLHFARNVEVARILLEHGADLNARDDDHQSTPAQWLLGDSPEVVRLLLNAGAEPDLFIAVGLGDLELVRQSVDADPTCTGYRIGNNLGPYPGIGSSGGGGTILQWSLGFNRSPHEIALSRGQHEIYDFLLERTAAKPKLLIACMIGDEALARSTVTETPNVFSEFDEDDRTLLARACWETNRNTEAVRIMLDLGFSVDTPEHNHGYSPLHNAAWDGNTELVRLLIEQGHPIELKDPSFNATPLGWCIHAATEARCGSNDYAGTVKCLLDAGAAFADDAFPTGHAAIDAVLKAKLSL